MMISALLILTFLAECDIICMETVDRQEELMEVIYHKSAIKYLKSIGAVNSDIVGNIGYLYIFKIIIFDIIECMVNVSLI